ncbi:hypothetical protein AWH62_06360 [Maricaulis sp. W15]|uniref:LytTR family DNA-binding domain-containing protein n=1 Tax=Maricaulis sp. W15 TaxID=1772333 RepID=UPI0009490466|nr:LytTR family DNA-binding domain-containing protein [Maricaulis sp. W15]OLF75438.1 hypothetical protein AWH62_06360 [Maricaulis sp. W15]
MALVDDLREVRFAGFPIRPPFLAMTTAAWLVCLLVFSAASWVDIVRNNPGAPYLPVLLGWTRGMAPWLILFPLVFKLGARHANSRPRETLTSALTAGVISMTAVAAYAAIAFSIGTGRSPVQTLIDFGLQAFLWDIVFYVVTFLLGRQMRPTIDPRAYRSPEFGSLAVKSSGRVEYVPVRDILGATAQGNYIALHLADRDVLHRTTMAQLEHALTDAGFVRIHRSHLVNPACISIARSRGESFRIVELTNGTQLPVSDRYRNEVRDQLDQRVIA